MVIGLSPSAAAYINPSVQATWELLELLERTILLVLSARCGLRKTRFRLRRTDEPVAEIVPDSQPSSNPGSHSDRTPIISTTSALESLHVDWEVEVRSHFQATVWRIELTSPRWPG
jgi:hypothetical protein